MTFLLLELILADQVADLHLPQAVVFSGQEWQYEISTVRAHIDRSTGRYTPHPLECKASWNVYYGMYLAAIVASSRKGGNLLLFLNN